MPGRITFDFGSANLKSEFYEILNSVAMVFEDFDKTYIDVYGHTDSIGSLKYYYKLSYRRANCVAEYLKLPRAVILCASQSRNLVKPDPLLPTPPKAGDPRTGGWR
jgi:hypothetical protein